VTVEFLPEHEYSLWDAFVAQHPLGLIYHLSSWKDVLERTFSHIKGHFLVLRDESGAIIAGIPVYVVRSWLLGNRIVSIPYASICDPLINNLEQYKKFIPALAELQKKTESRSIEIRTLKATSLISHMSNFAATPSMHHYLTLDRPAEALRKKFSYSVHRAINKAQRHGLQVRQELNESALHVFYQLTLHTRRRLGLPPTPFLFFDSMARAFPPEQMNIIFAMFQGQAIGAWLTLNFKDMLYLEYYGGNAYAYNEGASYLVTWEAIQCALARECKLLSFGCTDPWNEGLLTFKRRWATDEENIGISKISIRSNKLFGQYKSVKSNMFSRWTFSHAPQPVCEMLASFIYHHHG
jgi:lipid II:glycine glycyltransferase (peptidoglycan interpeptide bridge formation enzyme)